MYISAHDKEKEGKPLEVYIKADKAKEGKVRTFSSRSDLRQFIQRMADKLAGREDVELSYTVQGWTGFPWYVRPQRKAK